MISLDLLILLIVSVLFFVVGGVVAFMVFSNLRWPMRWELYEELVPGHLTRTKKGKMRFISFGDGGEEIFYLKFLKSYRAAYGRRVGARTVAWGKGQDGYWYNITFEGVNKRLAQVGVMPVDRDMRLANAQIRKGIEVEYKKEKFMDKYGTIIAFGMLFMCILAMGGFVYMAFDKQKDISSANAETAKLSKEIISGLNDLLLRQENIKSGGTGFTPAATT